jgi:DNA-damage-inducible protein J
MKLCDYIVATNPLEGLAMAADSVVRVRIDEETKKRAAEVLAEAGITTSIAVRMFLTRIARDGELALDFFRPNKETLEAIEEARSGNPARFNTLEEMFQSLDADD